MTFTKPILSLAHSPSLVPLCVAADAPKMALDAAPADGLEGMYPREM